MRAMGYIGLAIAPLLLSACKGSDTPNAIEAKVVYSVEITNLTPGQPLSHGAAVINQDGGFHLWKLCQSASVPLERLAEGGDPNPLVETSFSGGASQTFDAVSPGETTQFKIEAIVKDPKSVYFSTAQMLAKTNDGFTGVDSLALGSLAVGQSMTVYSSPYDAGTELNAENKETVPGLGGEGFNPERNDSASIVTFHPGVIKNTDGQLPYDDAYPDSLRFNTKKVAKIKVTRVE